MAVKDDGVPAGAMLFVEDVVVGLVEDAVVHELCAEQGRPVGVLGLMGRVQDARGRLYAALPLPVAAVLAAHLEAYRRALHPMLQERWGEAYAIALEQVEPDHREMRERAGRGDDA